MAYAILRVAKLKQSNLPGSSSHTHRERATPNADPELTSTNKTLLGRRPIDDVKARVAEITEARQEAGARKIRSDAVVAVEHVLTASPEFFEGADQDNIDQWASDCLQFLKNKYGNDNIVCAELHLDESTPHLHAYHVPASHDPQGIPTLSAKNFYNGKNKLSQLQTEYAEHLKQAGHDLQRGLKGSRAEHQHIRQFYSQINRKAPQAPKTPAVPTPPAHLSSSRRQSWAEKQNQKIRKKLSTIIDRLQKAIRQAKFWKSRAHELEQKAQAYADLDSSPEALKRDQIQAQRVPKLEAQIDSLQRQVSNQEKELADLRYDKKLLDSLEHEGIDRNALRQPANTRAIKDAVMPQGEPEAVPAAKDPEPGQSREPDEGPGGP